MMKRMGEVDGWLAFRARRVMHTLMRLNHLFGVSFLAFGFGCGPSPPDHSTSSLVSEATATDTAVTSGMTGASAGSTSEISSSESRPTTSTSTDCTASGSSGFDTDPDLEKAALQCENAMNREACQSIVPQAVKCRWHDVDQYEECGSKCEKSVKSSLCVAVTSESETSCEGPCPGYWKRNDSGLYIFQNELCFEALVGWQRCNGPSSPPECWCDCAHP